MAVSQVKKYQKAGLSIIVFHDNLKAEEKLMKYLLPKNPVSCYLKKVFNLPDYKFFSILIILQIL